MVTEAFRRAFPRGYPPLGPDGGPVHRMHPIRRAVWRVESSLRGAAPGRPWGLRSDSPNLALGRLPSSSELLRHRESARHCARKPRFSARAERAVNPSHRESARHCARKSRFSARAERAAVPPPLAEAEASHQRTSSLGGWTLAEHPCAPSSAHVPAVLCDHGAPSSAHEPAVLFAHSGLSAAHGGQCSPRTGPMARAPSPLARGVASLAPYKPKNHPPKHERRASSSATLARRVGGAPFGRSGGWPLR